MENQNQDFTLKMIGISFLGVPIIFSGLILSGIVEPQGLSENPMIAYILMGYGLIATLVAPLVGSLIRGAAEKTNEAKNFIATILTFAIAESAAICGLVIHILEGKTHWGLFLCAVSFVVTLLNFPKAIDS